VLCGYDDQVDPALLAAAERLHPVIIDRDGRRASSSYLGSGPGVTPAETLSSPPGEAESVMFRDDQAAVRRFAEEAGRRAGLRPDRLIDLILVVGELAGNTLLHTKGRGRLTIWRTGAELVCQVSDTGHITDPLAGTLCPDPGATGSRRGLWLVHQVCDLVQVRSGTSGTTIRVHLALT
jgi:anti-sigma regulatory factor (Ser/Thr protein kinase)